MARFAARLVGRATTPLSKTGGEVRGAGRMNNVRVAMLTRDEEIMRMRAVHAQAAGAAAARSPRIGS